VPLLLGSNADEGRPLVAGRDVRLSTFASDIGKAFDSTAVRDLAAEYLATFPAATDQDARELRARFERDLRFGWDIWTWARLQATAGRGKVFYYSFAHLPPYPLGSPFEGWGAGHWAELPYVFDHLDQEPWPWRDTDRALAQVMATFWTNFARSGDPNGSGLPLWPNFTSASERVLHLDGTVTAGGVPNLAALRLLDRQFSALRSATTVRDR
jgi:para-nitrobenzyl esterase